MMEFAHLEMTAAIVIGIRLEYWMGHTVDYRRYHR
jgi:hypothetical protein